MVERRGFTLIEMIVYMGLSVLLLGLVATFFKVSRRQYEATSSSLLIGQEASLAVQWIRRDLQETALSTIRVTRDGSSQPGLPAMSFVASTEDKSSRSFKVSRYGTPDWNRRVFYSLTNEGELYRWDRELEELSFPKSFLPLPFLGDPTDQGGAENRKILLREVMQPNQEIKVDGKDADFPKITEWGGFRIGFVVRDEAGDEHLVSQNPAQLSEMLAEDSGASVDSLEGQSLDVADLRATRLVEVRLALKLKGFRESSPNATILPIRVSPLH